MTSIPVPTRPSDLSEEHERVIERVAKEALERSSHSSCFIPRDLRGEARAQSRIPVSVDPTPLEGEAAALTEEERENAIKEVVERQRDNEKSYQ